jgi:hypothetical protein
MEKKLKLLRHFIIKLEKMKATISKRIKMLCEQMIDDNVQTSQNNVPE